MFKGNNKYILIFAGLFALIILAQYLIPKPIDWSRNYLSKNKSPFGCYAIYNVLDGTFSEKTQRSENTLFQLYNNETENSTLLIVNESVNFNKNDLIFLDELMKNGNSIFIAANRFEGAFADSMHISTDFNFSSWGDQLDSLVKQKGEQIEFTANNLKSKKYIYPRLLSSAWFSRFDSTRFKVLAFYDKNKPCLIKTSHHNGHIYLMSIPDVFGNYFIANHENRHFVYSMLSMIKTKHLLWDESYKTYNVTNDSFLKFVLESDPLYAAYLLMLLAIVLYMIFEGRRRQRAIPILTTPVNSTLEFVSVISHVYYNSKNHHHIAEEKIRYFYESVRKKFNVSTTLINEAFVSEITELSGIDAKLVKQLFLYCEHLKKSKEVTEYDLVELNRQIHNFNKNSLR